MGKKKIDAEGLRSAALKRLAVHEDTDSWTRQAQELIRGERQRQDADPRSVEVVEGGATIESLERCRADACAGIAEAHEALLDHTMQLAGFTPQQRAALLRDIEDASNRYGVSRGDLIRAADLSQTVFTTDEVNGLSMFADSVDTIARESAKSSPGDLGRVLACLRRR